MTSPDGSITVERVGAEAASDVYAVVRAAFEARPAMDPPADALAETPASIAKALGRSRGLLVRHEGEPVGATLLDLRTETVFLRRFGVHPAAQGKGIASVLVDAAVKAVPTHRSMTVLARAEMPRTVDFWKSKGFEEEAALPPYRQLRRALATQHVVTDAEQMRDLGRRVGLLLEAGDVLVLTGELGAGKTTFTQGLGEGLGVRPGITSPTFVIARVHPPLGDGPSLVHADAYRLGGIDELDDLDLDASLDEAVTVIEWGAGVAEGLSTRRLEVTITRALGGEVAAGETDGSLEDHDPRVVEFAWVDEQ